MKTPKRFYTIQEVMMIQGDQFPFWAAPWKVSHSILLVKAWSHGKYDYNSKKLIHYTRFPIPQGAQFVGDMYTPDKRKLLKETLLIGAGNQYCWAPA